MTVNDNHCTDLHLQQHLTSSVDIPPENHFTTCYSHLTQTSAFTSSSLTLANLCAQPYRCVDLINGHYFAQHHKTARFILYLAGNKPESIYQHSVFAACKPSFLTYDVCAHQFLGINQSFFFDWNPPGQPVPIPTTEQCEVIHITWGRGNALGPNPQSPYYLLVYASTFTTPIVIPAGGNSGSLSFDWHVPFAPGTQYQICMFDAVGNTGGCQATYTVIPPRSTPTCSNVTFPPRLNVQAQDHTGLLSQYGFIDQCTDVSVRPLNGTPPYTLTVAPALHPPYNITSENMKSINWTISLSWATPFFISLTDSNGVMWSNGPLHSGGPGTTTACLSEVLPSSLSVKPAVAVGASIGTLFMGILFGLLVSFIILENRKRKNKLAELSVDPFDIATSVPSDARRSPSQIYVVHHDNQTAPVTIYHQEQSRVVDLPPSYRDPQEGIDLGDNPDSNSASHNATVSTRSIPLGLQRARDPRPINKSSRR
ncbi:unnamed protein product [Cyclocybe aegerita]|uniref:Uncharacterized protein n=1 Tax=Cyclocybe aegerita TaxID=1973307 RepID=A0A8S0X4E1_CYCAE|nr:unnamed protein product [Cyclocybe aegerita]